MKCDMDGILNILKPAGMTSFDVVACLRGLLGIKKIGHAGTLDPMAVGVLPVCTGRATKAIEFMMDKDKLYRAELRLGVTTDTQDSTGNVLSTCDVVCSDEEIEKAVASFEGKYMQLPPMYSALRVEGKRLYELAREGTRVERKPREVEIYSSRMLYINRSDGVRVLLDVHCSKGTYIRTLCADIGQRLGCGGHMSFLLRQRAGAFDIDSAYTLEQLSDMKEKGQVANAFSKVDYIFMELDSITLDETQEKRFRNAVAIDVSANIDSGEIPGYKGRHDKKYQVRVYSLEGNFIALGFLQPIEDKTYLKVRKFF